jgi:hypothetical protein
MNEALLTPPFLGSAVRVVVADNLHEVKRNVMAKRGTSTDISNSAKRQRASGSGASGTSGRRSSGSAQLTVQQRLALIRAFDEDNSYGAQARLAERFGVSKARVSQILKHRAEIEAQADDPLVRRQALRARKQQFPALERRLIGWILQEQLSSPFTRRRISMQAVCKKAQEIAKEGGWDREGFKATRGWFFRFKQRAGLQRVQLDGEDAASYRLGVEEESKQMESEATAQRSQRKPQRVTRFPGAQTERKRDEDADADEDAEEDDDDDDDDDVRSDATYYQSDGEGDGVQTGRGRQEGEAPRLTPQIVDAWVEQILRLGREFAPFMLRDGEEWTYEMRHAHLQLPGLVAALARARRAVSESQRFGGSM